MFGSHLSVAGGLHLALTSAKEVGFDCVQVFTKNQRRWVNPPLTDQVIADWRDARRSTGIDVVVSHVSYLINMAAADRAIREKSIRLMIDEIERCETLDIAFAVVHPGSHVGQGEAKGIKRIAGALDRIHKRTPGYQTLTCLEITAGQGSSIGHDFEQIRRIIDSVAEPDRLAVCFDTAHALAAGHDLTSAKGARAVMAEFDQIIGLDRLRVFHINDSKTPRGSRVDRHEHIGHGHVSPQALAAILRKRCFSDVPKILETPKADTEDGEPWDRVNLKKLKQLRRGGRKR